MSTSNSHSPRLLTSQASPRNEQGPEGGGSDRETLSIGSMSSNTGRRRTRPPDVIPANWKELLYWLGNGGAFLSCTFTTIFLGGFGSFMPAQFLWVCCGIVVLSPMVSLGVGPSWAVIWRYVQDLEHTRTDDDSFPEQPIGAGESPGILLNVSLACTLLGLMADWKPGLEFSTACGDSCSSRFRESLHAIVIMVLLLEGLPALILRLDVVRRYSAWIIIVKHILQERNHSILTKEQGMKLQSFQSSALSYVINLMGSFHGRGHSNQRVELQGDRPSAGWPHLAANVFRGLVQGSLSILLITIVAKDAFYPSTLPQSLCDETCRRNTKALLIVKCGCTIAQAVSLQTAPLQSLSALLLLPLLLYSALALLIAIIAGLALIAVVTTLAGAILALAAGAAGIVAIVAVPVGVVSAVYLVLTLLYRERIFFRSKRCIVILFLIVIALVLVIGSVKKEREWPWFFLKKWGVLISHFFKRLWKGMTHEPSR